MADQNVGTPRFYVNTLEWLISNMKLNGYGGVDQFRTLPVEMTSTGDGGWDDTYAFSEYHDVPVGSFTDKSFYAILGLIQYKPTGSDKYTTITPIYSDDVGVQSFGSDGEIFINSHASGSSFAVDYNGFSIGSFDATGVSSIGMRLDYIREYGSIVLGTYYDLPHSPDLNIKMSREMDGVKRLRTRGGSDLVNYKHKRSPNWGNAEPYGAAAPWELWLDHTEPDYSDLGSPTDLTLQKLARYGKRTWDLSFSYLNAKDLRPAVETLNQSLVTDSIDDAGNAEGTVLTGLGWDSDDVDDSDSFAYNLLDHNDFYSQVIHKTSGGRLPFIFQPDKDDETNLAICKFDMNKFSYEQVANGVYNVKLKIREVW